MRAATSVSLTIGVAFATLLVVGGILAGPAILDCTHQSGGIGACLRGKVQQSGLLPRPAASSSEIPVSVQSSSSVAPPIVAETTSRAPGWIEANATEYEAPPPSVAALSPLPGMISGQGIIAPGNGSEAAATVAAPAGLLTAAGRRPAADEPTAEVALVEPAGRLSANGSATAVLDPTSATLAPSPGALAVDGLGGPGNGASALATTQGSPPGSPTVTGTIGGNTAPSAAATLEADLTPPAQALPDPVIAAPPPVAPAPKIIRKPAPVPKAAAIAKPKTGPQRVLKFNPHYPSVLVLPPPNTGANSSFATLEVR